MSVTTRALANFEVKDAAYGAATDAIQRVIESAKRHQWFARVAVDAQTSSPVRDRLARHFDVLGERAMARPSSVEFIQGSWDVLARAYREINPAGEDPAYGRGKWREALGVVVGEMRRELERSHRDSIVPPIFPNTGNAAIVGGMLMPQMGGIDVVDDEEHRQTVWYLMCDVDADFWSAIIWPLAYPEQRNENPFDNLVAVYESGFYPLGFSGDRFIVYSYT
jgi:hypothetical protein